MSLALATTLPATFEEAVERTRAALADQGFGVLTEIDVQATMKAKLDKDMEPYLILGACNPTLAHRALGVQRQIGLLLPCNVVVRTDPDRPDHTLVEAMNPDLMIEVSDEPDLEPVARDAAEKLRAAIDTLSTQP